MRHAIITVLAALLLAALAGTAVAGPFEDAVSAHKRGDYATALREFRVLAAQGHAIAQYNLGVMYYEGEGVPKDYAEAVKWFQLAAEQDYAEAVKWFQLAAEQGDADAQHNLGVLYSEGQVVPQDYAEAAKWYRRAADQGLASAQFNLALMHAIGQGVPQDYAEAVKWFQLAAEQGHADSQYNLALMYAQGWGVPLDYVEAHMWFNLAGAQGVQQAAKDQDIVAQLMTPAQIAEAQKLAREWKSGAISRRHVSGKVPGMDGPFALKVALLALTFGFGFTIVGYDVYAGQKGWAVGAWSRDETSFANILGFLGVISAPIVALWLMPWWTLFIVLVGGFLFGLVTTNILKARVRPVALAGLVTCWIANILYVLP